MSILNNTTGLEEILAMVNALPEAGEGGSGGAKLASGTLTFTEVIDHVPIVHNLGERPNFIIVVPAAGVMLPKAVLGVLTDDVDNAFGNLYISGNANIHNGREVLSSLPETYESKQEGIKIYHNDENSLNLYTYSSTTPATWSTAFSPVVWIVGVI